MTTSNVGIYAKIYIFAPVIEFRQRQNRNDSKEKWSLVNYNLENTLIYNSELKTSNRFSKRK